MCTMGGHGRGEERELSVGVVGVCLCVARGGGR
jgi:hypothetical protein